MTGMLIRLPEKMLGETEKTYAASNLKETFRGKQRRQTAPMGTFVDAIRANGTSIDMKGQKQTRGHKPGRNCISVRLFHDIVSSRDREVNQDTGRQID